MAGVSELYKAVGRCDEALQRCVVGKVGSARKLAHLRLSLLKLLEIGELDRVLRGSVGRLYGGKKLLADIHRKVAANDYAVPKAIYDHVHWRTGLKTSCCRWGCPETDVVAVNQLAWRVDRELGSFTDSLQSSEVGCLDEVEAFHEEIKVFVSSHALEHVLATTLEAYLVPKNKRVPFTEAYGLCLGMVRDQPVASRGNGRNRIRHVYVEQALVQLRAKVTSDSFAPNTQSFKAHLQVAQTLYPHLEIVGEFHSHPYRSARALRNVNGWMFSPADKEYVGWWQEKMRENGQEPLLDFIVAIGKEKRSSGLNSRSSRMANRKCMRIGRNLVMLSAYRILRNGRHEAGGIELRVPSVVGG